MIEIQIKRHSEDEATFAVVRADAQHESDSEFLASVNAAVSKWMTETEEGAHAWESSCQDFNIGDLSNYDLSDAEGLGKYLSQEGINCMNIEIHSAEYFSDDWTYDTVLGGVEELDLTA